jgi:hypothetical protein
VEICALSLARRWSCHTIVALSDVKGVTVEPKSLLLLITAERPSDDDVDA